MNRFAALLVALPSVLALGCAPSSAVRPKAASIPAIVAAPTGPGRFTVVGRGVVKSTRTTDLAVFRAPNGRDYALTGTYGLCGGCTGNKVFVWDVTDPTKPVRTDSVVLDAKMVNAVAVNAEGTLAVATRERAESRRNGIVVLDLSDPAHPRQIADYWETITGGARAVWIDGRYAYVVDAGTAEMVVIDLSNPRDPRQVGRFRLPGLARPDRYLSAVSVKDGLAYLSYWNEGLVIVDVGRGIKGGTPQNPELVSQFRYQTKFRGASYGNTHYAFPYTNRAGRQYVFVGDEIFPRNPDFSKPVESAGFIHVLDVSRLEQPIEVATYAVPGAGDANFWVADDVLYSAFYSAGVVAVDVSGELRGDLTNRTIASFSTRADSATAFAANLPMAWGVMPHRGYVYASDFNSGLWVAKLDRTP